MAILIDGAIKAVTIFWNYFKYYIMGTFTIWILPHKVVRAIYLKSKTDGICSTRERDETGIQGFGQETSIKETTLEI